jgi:ribonuclease D
MNESSDPVVSKPPRYSRAVHRNRQHESAHAEGADDMPQRIIDHPLVPSGPGELIGTDAALREFVDHLREQRSFAYDSEFIGELSYHPKLCVIQASTTQRIGLIDPIAQIDLQPFWELLCDEDVEKIVHAGEQDIEPVHRLTGKPAANVFDTQIAAGFVALAYPIGLSKLVHELLGVRLGKGLTFTHWDQRPLTSQQLKYAADDVRYLHVVRAELGKRLDARGHAAWAREECDSLCDPDRYGFHPESYFRRIRGITSLTPACLSVLRELTIWRDAAARAHDVPARVLLKDEILLDMARSPIKSIDKLARVKGLPRPVEAEYGAAIVEATMHALTLPPEERPMNKNVETSPSERFGAETLYAVAAVLCAAQSIDPALVTSRQEVSDLHHALMVGNGESDVGLLKGWRRAACGQQLLDLFAGKGEVSFSWRDGSLTTDSQ